MNKNLVKGIIALLGLSFVFACTKTGSGAGGASGSAVAKAEAIMQEEMKQPAPDWVYPYKEVELDVPNMPEKVKWLTAEGKDLASKDAKVGGTMHFTTSEWPATFRYTGPESNGSMRSLMWMQASLLWQNEDTQTYLPYSATHWAYGADEKTMYFKLREDIKWSDGEKCTADDWLFAWECYVNPNLNDPYYNQWYKGIEVTVLGDYLLQIRWVDEEEDISKEMLIDYLDFRPRARHFFNGPLTEKWYEEYNWKYEPTTGPYVMKEDENVTGELLVFERVDNWWARAYPHFAGIGNVQKVEYKVSTGGADMMESYFYDGKIDVYSVAIPDAIRRSESKDPVTKGYIDRYYNRVIPLLGIRDCIFFNVSDPLFKSRDVRRAMYYAFDIQGMIDQALYGEYSRYHNIGLGQEFAGVKFNDDTIRKPGFSPEEAMKLLAKAGYTKKGNDGILMNDAGTRVSFELVYYAKHHTERMSILVEQAKKAGVEINLKLMESGYFEALRKKQYQAMFMGFNTGSVPSYRQFFYSAGTTDHTPESNNVWNYANPEMDKLIEGMEAAKTFADKAVFSKKIEHLVDDEALVVPVYYVGYGFTMAWKWVRFPAWGADKHESTWTDPIFGYLWIDEAIKAEVEEAMKAGKTFEPRYYHLTERYKQK